MLKDIDHYKYAVRHAALMLNQFISSFFAMLVLLFLFLMHSIMISVQIQKVLVHKQLKLRIEIFIIKESLFSIFLIYIIYHFFSFSVYVGKRDLLAGLAVPLWTLMKISPLNRLIYIRLFLYKINIHTSMCTTYCTQVSVDINYTDSNIQ